MAHNLVVTFDLRDALTRGAGVANAIATLGDAARILGSTWYVRSNLPATDAARRIWDAMDPADALCVFDASANEAAMYNVDDNAVQFMTCNWHRALEGPLERPLYEIRCASPR